MPFQRPKFREPLAEAGLFEYAVGTLARKMRSVRDLRRLMRSRAEPGDTGEQAMDNVIGRLVELSYLSDTRFAADYTRLRVENEKFGKRRVQQDLAQKGVARELIASTVETAYEDVDEVALARAYCAKKRIKQPGGEGVSSEDKQKQSARIVNRLMRAGFSSNAIFKLLRSWHVEVEESNVDDDASEFEGSS